MIDEQNTILPTLPASAYHENVDDKEQNTGLNYLGRFFPKVDGGKIYRKCLNTGDITEAVYVETEVYVPGSENQRDLIIEQNSAYVEALNMKNARRKFDKGRAFLTT